MNDKHRISALDESLGTIEQLDDRSELSTLYPNAKTGWDGQIISESERITRRDKQIDDFSLSIRKKAILIGFLIPLPIIVAGILIAILVQYIFPMNTVNPAYNALPSFVSAAIIMGVSYGVLRKLVHIFYEHTLRLGPFLAIMWALLGISAQSFYLATLWLHGNDGVTAVLYISSMGLFWSMALSIFLLSIWTSTRLSSGAKMGYIALVALGIVMVTSALSVMNVLL